MSKYRVIRNEPIPSGSRLVEFDDGKVYISTLCATGYALAEVKRRPTCTLLQFALVLSVAMSAAFLLLLWLSQ